MLTHPTLDQLRALKPIFYSWSGRTWRKPLILLKRRGHFCENVVPRL